MSRQMFDVILCLTLYPKDIPDVDPNVNHSVEVIESMTPFITANFAAAFLLASLIFAA